MPESFFRLARTQSPNSRVALEPVRNALNSMALLNLADTQPALGGWVRRTAAELAPAERETNRLLFEQLGYVLVANAEQPDFERYLDDLTQQNPMMLRDQMLSHFANGEANGRPSPAVQALLDD